MAEEKLGQYQVEHLKLKMIPGKDVAYPVCDLWVDKSTGNVLKRQDYADSGKLLRTTYYPAWNKVFSKSKNAEVYFPKEIRIIDEVEKGTQTTVVIQEVALDALDPNIFTKAWLESKSR